MSVSGEAILSALLGSLLGGGAIGTVGYLALQAKLAKDLGGTFASIADLNGLGERVTAASSVAIMAKDTADQNSDRLVRLEESSAAERAAISRTLQRIDKTLEDIDTRQRKDRSAIDKTAALLDEVQRRLDRADHH